MMQSLPDHLQALLGAARRYAAGRATFDPADLMASVGGLADPVLMVDVLSLLRKDCAIDGEQWTMRPGARRKVLAVAEPISDPLPDQMTPVQQALAGYGDFDPNRLIELVKNGADVDYAALAACLDQAGPAAPAYDHLVALRAAMNAANHVKRTDETLAKGFVGRDAELHELASWIAKPFEKPPLQSWHISGLPGIGKSYLLEKVIQDARLSQAPILVRLDFDRAALDVLNAYAFFEEISRQFADAIPASAARLRALRLASATERGAGGPRRKQRQTPFQLIEGLTEISNDTGRPVLFVLDTLEMLRSQGETHVMVLFEHLDLLMEFGMRRIAVVSAGRGDALSPAPKRMFKNTILDEIEEDAAKALLQIDGVPSDHWPRILPLAKGNPLLLRLAAKAVADGALGDADVPSDPSVASVSGYLYRAILSRVPEDQSAVANYGLVLHALNAELLQRAVGPALGLSLNLEQAVEMLDLLATHHWLVEPKVDGWLRHRSDVRSAFLPLIYADDPKMTAAIDSAACNWFATRDPVRALYHRLQLIRVGEPLPEIDPDLAADMTDTMLADLPDTARDKVLQAQGKRSDFGRQSVGHVRTVLPPAGKATEPAILWSRKRNRLVFDTLGPVEAPDERALTDLRMMIERRDIREARYIVSSAFARPLAIQSPAGALMLAQQWQSGHWTAAKTLWKMLGFEALNDSLDQGDHIVGRLLLEVAAEFDFATLVARLRARDLPKFALELIAYPPSFASSRGALDFAALVGVPDQMPAADQAAAGVLAHHMNMLDRQPHGDAYAEAERLRQRIGVDLRDGESQPMFAVMPLNPYGSFLAARAPLLPAVEATIERFPLTRLAQFFAPGVEEKGALAAGFPTAAGKIDALEALGLTAEWAGAVTAYHSVPDLPLIARSAERWRRTVAGVWSYDSAPPIGWTGRKTGPDDGAVALMDAIMADPDTVCRARRSLLAWLHRSGDANRLIRRLRGRYEKLMRQPKRPRRAAAHANFETLRKSGLPMVIAAPLAVLAAHHFDLKRI